MNPRIQQAQELINDVAMNSRADLTEVVNTLKALTDAGELRNFTFRNNKNQENRVYQDTNPVFVVVETNAKQNIFLGSGDLVGFNFDQVSHSTKNQLEDIAQYLDFVNTHCARDLPLITHNTFYTPNASNNLEYWAEHQVQILPDFSAESKKLKL